MADCLFCSIASGKIPSKVVYSDDDVVAFEDINPQAPTHVLVIPREHTARILDLDEDSAAIVGKMVLAANKIAQERGFAADGYRLVINCNEGAGQSVWHIHLHLLGGRKFGWPPG